MLLRYAQLLLLLPSLSAQATDRQPPTDELGKFVQPFVREWCGQCHSGRKPEGDLNLVEFFKTRPGVDALELLIDIRDMLADGEMPPDDEPEPEAADRRRMIRFIEQTIAGHKHKLDPGRVTMRRLSRIEYRNTVRDLLGVDEDVTTGFPADDLGYGFDNIGDARSVSVLHIEKYAAAARRITELTIASADPANPPRRTFEVEEHASTGGASRRGDYLVFTSNGSVAWPVQLPRAGEYLVRVHGFGQQAGDQPARLAISLDGQRRAVVDVTAERGKPATYERKLRLPGGEHRLGLAFINDYYQPKHADPRRRDRNLYLDFAELVGPVDRRPESALRRQLFAADPGTGSPAERARPMLAPLLRRAWRRPVTDAEVGRIARVVADAVQAGDSFEDGIQLGVQAILVSPSFLFRIEPGGTTAAPGQQTEPLGDHALATRLAYFLWSSLPDEQLDRLADQQKLQDPAVLVREARRMLADRRADALANNFAAQWLELRALDEVTPDPQRFPGFDAALRRAMRTETERFFLAVLREQRSIYDLIDADFTFLDERLARHYGIDGVQGAAFRRVALADGRRGGLLGHASIQTVTSNPTRTSPVKRGKWILDNILDDPPPPPDPGSASFKPGTDVSVAATLRSQLAEHRKSKDCAICHNRMDPLGLALENFDAIGRWRDQDHGIAIDASGQLPDGRALDGPASLKQVLRASPVFRRCVAKKLFLYAVGREVRGADAVVLEGLVESLGPAPTLTDMITGIVRLDAFRRRLLVR